jgi:hypothetical protein
MYEVLFETPAGLHCLQPTHGPSSVSLPTPHTSGAEASAEWLDGAQPPLMFTTRRGHCEYLNLKWFHSHSFKECVYLLTKTFIQIIFFSEFLEGGGGMQPL